MKVPENELAMLFVVLGVFALLLKNRSSMVKIPEYKILIASFSIFLIATLVTVIEELAFNKPLNYVEHVCYALSSILTAVWCMRVVSIKGKQR